MMASMPFLAIRSRALAMRCRRSAELIGGGSGIAGSSAAACAISRSSGRVMAAATAPAPPSSARLEILEFIMSPYRDRSDFLDQLRRDDSGHSVHIACRIIFDNIRAHDRAGHAVEHRQQLAHTQSPGL